MLQSPLVFTMLLLANHFPISSLSLRSLSVSAALSQRAEPSRVEPPEQKQAQLMRKTMAGSALTSACIAGVSLTSLLARIEANVSLLHPPPSREMTSDASSSSSSSSSELKVGIALMTRQPHRFDWWLRYHRSLGVHHVFVHVEDSPELLPLLQSDEFESFVSIVAKSGDEGDSCSAIDVNVSAGAVAPCPLPPSRARMGNCASSAGLDPTGLASRASMLTHTSPDRHHPPQTTA